MFGNTRSERLAADQVLGDCYILIEMASRMLYDLWDRWFNDDEQKALDSDEAAEVGRIIFAAMHLIDDDVTSYHLKMGHFDDPRVEAFRWSAQKYEKVCECEELLNEKREKGIEGKEPPLVLEDEKAIEYLKAALGKNAPENLAKA